MDRKSRIKAPPRGNTLRTSVCLARAPRGSEIAPDPTRNSRPVPPSLGNRGGPKLVFRLPRLDVPAGNQLAWRGKISKGTEINVNVGLTMRLLQVVTFYRGTLRGLLVVNFLLNAGVLTPGAIERTVLDTAIRRDSVFTM